MALPSWVAPDTDKPAPMPLLRVQAFVNTLDVDLDTDVLSEAGAARAWLADAGWSVLGRRSRPRTSTSRATFVTRSG